MCFLGGGDSSKKVSNIRFVQGLLGEDPQLTAFIQANGGTSAFGFTSQSSESQIRQGIASARTQFRASGAFTESASIPPAPAPLARFGTRELDPTSVSDLKFLPTIPSRT